MGTLDELYEFSLKMVVLGKFLSKNYLEKILYQNEISNIFGKNKYYSEFLDLNFHLRKFE